LNAARGSRVVLVDHERELPGRARSGDTEAFDVIVTSHRTRVYALLFQILRKVEELSYEEIAARTRASMGTIMSRLFYARKHLQSLLKDAHERF
jgi:hypothetical protein